MLLILTNHLYADTDEANYQTFKTLFKEWTEAFNHKDIDATCALFSKSVKADYRGVPPKNFKTICDGFRKVFADPNRIYRYRFRLHKVYLASNLAATRITWYLTVYAHGENIAETQDEGLDVLEKNKSGKWQIVNYLGYPVGDETI